MKYEFEIDWTWNYQIELLPRLTILYGSDRKGIAIEFLWLSVSYIKVIKE